MLQDSPLTPLRILFIGNSYTFYHEMPKQISQLAKSGRRIETEWVARGGCNLTLHWKKTGAREKLAAGGWTHVVIQELSTGTLHSPCPFYWYGRRFARLAKRVGAQPLFFQTWPRRDGHEVYRSAWSGGDPSAMLAKISQSYALISDKSGGSVVPVGKVWHAFTETFDLNLYDDDDHHAALPGAFLAACVFFRSLGGDLERASYIPEGLPEEAATQIRQHVHGADIPLQIA